MNKEFEYIKGKLDEILKISDSISIRYEYENLSRTHIVEILPQSFYNESDELMNLELDIIEEFNSHYNESTLCFISEDSLIKIKEPSYTKSSPSRLEFECVPEFHVSLSAFEQLDFSLPNFEFDKICVDLKYSQPMNDWSLFYIKCHSPKSQINEIGDDQSTLLAA